MKPFRIFRPGTHTASCGTKVEFTEDDLKRAVAAYSPQTYAAPLVIGHPKTEDRAYGWAEALTYENGYVVAHPDKVEPAFAELVESGAYRNRSASWYMPDHPSNPSPGNLYPKHIGFLGAVPPSLKGLGDVQFQEGQAPVDFGAEEHPELVVEFADQASWSMASAFGTLARLLRTFRDMRIEEKGLEEADRLIPDYVIRDAEQAAADLQTQASKSVQPAFTEPTDPRKTAMTPEQIAALQADRDALASRVTSFTERETALQAAERLARVDGIDRDTLAPLVAAGKVLPAQRKAIANFMADLDDTTQVIEFGEAVDGNIPKVSPLAFFKGHLNSLPKQVDYSDRGSQTVAGGGAITPTQLAAKATAVRERIKREEHRDISFTEAANLALAEAGVEVLDPSNVDATA